MRNVGSTKSRSHANRGKLLESYIEQANTVYRLRKQAVINKNHPEVTVTKMKGKEIAAGFYKEKGGPDYSGLANGRAIMFDAKETKITNFPLGNVHDHQVEELKLWQEQGGISFLIVRFVNHQKVFVLQFDHLYQKWHDMIQGGPKSIPYQFFEENCDTITAGGGVALDWLAVIRKQRSF